jgi:hypothetical protein
MGLLVSHCSFFVPTVGRGLDVYTWSRGRLHELFGLREDDSLLGGATARKSRFVAFGSSSGPVAFEGHIWVSEIGRVGESEGTSNTVRISWSL